MCITSVPFLYTGKKNAKKPVIGKLSDNWQYQYLSIDKTKALTHLQKCTRILVFALTHLPGTSKTGFREVKIMNEFV
jgi:hypothetical protein